jgi:hypothetical protein
MSKVSFKDCTQWRVLLKIFIKGPITGVPKLHKKENSCMLTKIIKEIYLKNNLPQNQQNNKKFRRKNKT